MTYMTICFDLDKTNEASATRFDGSEATLEYFQKLLGYLMTHNKNYTQKQYYAIDELNELFNYAELVKEESI